MLYVGAAGVELELARVAAHAAPAEPRPVRVRRAVRLEHLDHVELVVVRGDVGLRAKGHARAHHMAAALDRARESKRRVSG